MTGAAGWQPPIDKDGACPVGGDGQAPVELKTQVLSFCLMALITASLEVALTVISMPSLS